MSGLSNYPPGVTGNEPQISGRFDPADLNYEIAETTKRVGS